MHNDRERLIREFIIKIRGRQYRLSIYWCNEPPSKLFWLLYAVMGLAGVAWLTLGAPSIM